jgi:class 3 adenylate cyclase
MRAFLQTYISYTKAALISLVCATAVCIVASVIHEIVNESISVVVGLLLLIVIAIFIRIILMIRRDRDGYAMSLVREYFYPTYSRKGRDAAKPVSLGGENVGVVAMFIDLREVSQRGELVPETNVEFFRKYIEDIHTWLINQSMQGRPNLVKFLGDGLMLIWEIQDDSMTVSANRITELAYALSNNYLSMINEERHQEVFPEGVPKEIKISVDIGSAIRLTLDNGPDYLGAPLSVAAKMQDIARPGSGVMIHKNVWDLLHENLRSKFTKQSLVNLGGRDIAVRLTEDTNASGG